MDNEKEIDFKPSTWLYIFLFIYYSVWLLQSFGAISHYITYGLDSFKAHGLIEWLYFALFFVSGIYSFYAVIKTLRGDKDCITSLKWSLMLVFAYTLLNPTRGQIPTYDLATWLTIFLVRPLFYLVFYLYLCFAKGIKRRYPKVERKFGPSGWVWVGLMFAFLGVAVYGVWQQRNIDLYCKPVEVYCLTLNKGDVCDRYIIFKSSREWENWDSPDKSIQIDERLFAEPTLISADSVCQIFLYSGRCDKPDARTYNQVIVNTLGARELKELTYTDTIIGGKRMFYSCFESKANTFPEYLDVTLLIDSISPKCSIFVRSGSDAISPSWSVELARDVRFDLKNVANREYDKHCNHTQDKHTNGAPKRKHQTEANMSGSLFHRFCPRHFLCITTLKNNEGEITYRESDNIFYNL